MSSPVRGRRRSREAARTRHSALDVGSVIGGRLVLRRLVATGGMGAVWVARNTTTEAEVAVKILLPGIAAERQGAARFRHEAKVGAVLAHRNITRVYDLLQHEDGSLVLVMELLRGETLAEYLARRGALAPAEAVALLVPVLRALAHAHEQGVVHRDLKPANVLLHVDPDGHLAPKLLDFGIAKVRDSSIITLAGDALGTPSYMSPEQVRSLTLDGRSDLFSVGIVLHQLVTGKNPFQGDTPASSLARVLENEVDADPAIPAALWLELKRVLAKQPYVRHANANDLADRLLAALDATEESLAVYLKRERPPLSSHDFGTVVISAAPVVDADPPSKTRPTQRRRRAWRRNLALAVVGAAAVLATVGLMARPAPDGERAAPPAEPVPGALPSAVATGADVPLAPALPAASSASAPTTAVISPAPSAVTGRPAGAVTARPRASAAGAGAAPSVPPSGSAAPARPVARTPGF